MVQDAVLDRQRAGVVNGAAIIRRVGDAVDVVIQVAVRDRERAAVPDGAALAVERAGTSGVTGYAAAVDEVQVAQGDVRFGAIDLEYTRAEKLAADRYGCVWSARALDCQVLVDDQFRVGEHDGLTAQARGKLDGVAAVGGGDFRP